MQQQYKVSIITPVYNDELFIRETIESVLNQTYRNFEILVVDDCSTDRSFEIINNFKDNRIKIIKNRCHSGAAFSRNAALKEASGEFVAFLDGDDLWHPKKLENQLKFMIDNNIKFSYTQFYEINENGDSAGFFLTGPKKISHKKCLKTNYIGCLTVMYEKGAFPKLEIPNDIAKRNDYALWLKLTEVHPCFLLEEKLAFYRKRSRGSISSGKKSKLIKFHKELFQKVYCFSSFKSTLYAYRNVLFYILKKIKYRKKCDKND